MDERQMKGMEIAKMLKIRRNEKGWIVPSQSGHGTYLVKMEGHKPTCDCPDCQTRRTKCKHIWAVEYFVRQEIDAEGNQTITKAVRVTYAQD